MASYGVTFKDDGETIRVDAEFYELRDGFLRFYKNSEHGVEEFALYASDNIKHCVLQKEYTTKDITVEQAMNVIRGAMIKDDPSAKGSLARAWHCDIAMACYDSLNGTTPWRHKVSNAAASRFMKMCFDVEIEA
jgi:hypothetical protein